MYIDTPASKIRPVLILTFLCTVLLFLSNRSEAKDVIKMATTTSTENSGLLARLLPAFTKATGITVQTIAVGTGMALKHGENGDVDVVLVHARADEERFVQHGFGSDRREVMYNDFVIVGPSGDPAGVAVCSSAVQALSRIAASRATFISRGDLSGTHKKELELWSAAGIKPQGGWYIEAGQGMEQVLIITAEKQAYTLTDRGTLIAVKSTATLKPLYSGDPKLFNQYGVIAVNPARHPHVRAADAQRFIDWLTSQAGQELIAAYKINGKQLFFPNARAAQE
jgi:tungstate transport system substrate-binding protein